MFAVMNYPLQAVFNFLHNSLNFHEDVAGSNKLPGREKKSIQFDLEKHLMVNSSAWCIMTNITTQNHQYGPL